MQRMAELVSQFGFTGIGEFKKWLRGLGRSDLASRAGKLTKTRNAVAHPDVHLQDELRTLLETSNPQGMNEAAQKLRLPDSETDAHANNIDDYALPD